ncbi:MAG: hypothetical protein ABL997_00265 [Planctomycetota bacterium]
MQLEKIATPQEDSTPELRYASLHRAVERGMASQEVLRELAEICLRLGHVDEAVRVHAGMKPGPLREHVASRLSRQGLIERNAGAQPLARPLEGTSSEDDGQPSVHEHALDSIQYLTQGYMPAVALATMLAFPLVVGIGGVLTSGASPWAFAALVAPPGLCVLGIVGAMARQVFTRSASGDEDVPPIPAPPEMAQLAKRWLVDQSIVLSILIAPSIVLLALGAPLLSTLPGLLLGMFFTPIATILRQMRGDMRALSPVAMVRAIGCCRGYTRIAALYWGFFAPASLAFYASMGHAPWLQMAIVGPLAVLPAFVTARLLGTFTEAHRPRLGLLLQMNGLTTVGEKPRQHFAPSPKAPAASARPSLERPTGTTASHGLGGSMPVMHHTPLQRRPAAPAPAPARPQAAPKAPSAPKAQAAPKAPTAKATWAPKAPAARPSSPSVPPARMPKKPDELARRLEQTTPAPGSIVRGMQPSDWAQQPSEPRAKKPAPAPVRRPVAPPMPPAQIEGRAPKVTKATKAPTKSEAPAVPANPALGGPDLSGIPGATIITGEDRERLGAASRKA